MPVAKKSVKKTSPKRRKRPTKTSPKRRGRPTKTSPKRRGRPTRRRMNAPGDDEKTNEELLAEVADLREKKAQALEALRRLEETLEVHIRQMKWSYEAGNLDCADFSEEISDVKGGLKYIIEDLE